MAKDHAYTPTSGELNEAIADWLHEHPMATSKEVRSELLQLHKSWKLPERRITKFVKRQRKAGGDSVDSTKAGSDDHDDDDVSIASSIVQRTKNVVKGTGKAAKRAIFFGSGRSKKKEDIASSQRPEESSVPMAVESKRPPTLADRLLPSMSKDDDDNDDIMLDNDNAAVHERHVNFSEKLEEPIVTVSVNDHVPIAVDKDGLDRTLYVDDNDGKKDNKPCCEGCVML